MGACVTEEQAIAHAQYLDLVYSQSGMLYDYLPDALPPGTSKAPSTPYIDNVIISVSSSSRKSSANPVKKNPFAPTENASQAPSNSSNTSEVNAVQSTIIDKTSKGKKRGKGKDKVDQPK